MQELLHAGPGLVGATGGSGTRVVARILGRAGLFIGSRLNESEDAIALGEYSDRWINAYLPHRGGALPVDLEQAMLDDLAAVLAEHCAPVRAEPRPWGWKEPRCIYLLPFFSEHLPAVRFLHVVRDGRDMALSANQNQLRRHADSAGIPDELPEPVRSIALWSWINLETARYGTEQLGDRYLLVRFEDLCTRPEETSERVFAFFGLDGDPEVAREEVAPPATLGRWQRADGELMARLEHTGREALRHFGYELSAPR